MMTERYYPTWKQISTVRWESEEGMPRGLPADDSRAAKEKWVRDNEWIPDYVITKLDNFHYRLKSRFSCRAEIFPTLREAKASVEHRRCG